MCSLRSLPCGVRARGMVDKLTAVLLYRARLMKRNGFDEEQADKRVASQPMTNEERAARATLVVSNEGTEEQLAEKVWNFLMSSNKLY